MTESVCNEAETRAEHIDPALAIAGWGVEEGSRVRREYPIAPGRLEGYGRRGKSLTADYVLEYRNTNLAVIEATREERAARAKVAINTRFNEKQRAFLDFVLLQYVKVGVHELDKEKLSPLLKLKYNNAIADAIADLGKPEDIGSIFAGFQKYLYVDAA